eukprot:1179708-Prorocentrum_minimum.AAC.2
MCCAFSPDGGTLVTASADATARVLSTLATGPFCAHLLATEKRYCRAPSHQTEGPSSLGPMTPQCACGALATGPFCAPSLATQALCCCKPSHQTEGPLSLGLLTTQHACGALATVVWADGIDHHNDVTNDDADTSGDEDSDMSDSGRMTTGSERDEDDELQRTRFENAGLRAENDGLKAENDGLRSENAESRAEKRVAEA